MIKYIPQGESLQSSYPNLDRAISTPSCFLFFAFYCVCGHSKTLHSTPELRRPMVDGRGSDSRNWGVQRDEFLN